MALFDVPVTNWPAKKPIDTLVEPDTLFPARDPRAVLSLPVTLLPVERPSAAFSSPDTLRPARKPTAVLSLFVDALPVPADVPMTVSSIPTAVAD
ncbi:hypothetical protein DTO96_101394 [Ephemeroptericola cinctiostellae]|uniref:Uncharacterized protein n=1 Tax=Ephemeroptericola cinctiostellae TaxID=2268024 RepID=A0A345DBC5_9BURK|nr:hypothetical protein [Ephemeroptericola cinctiostellae]AXF85663.1 hypothetical protein DTO96_101394 [Ephemeroptericola cinctiostellae]